jgi:hypothetical protein
LLGIDGAGGAATSAEAWEARQKKNYDHLKGPEKKAAMEDDKRVLPHREVERMLRMNRMATVRPRRRGEGAIVSWLSKGTAIPCYTRQYVTLAYHLLMIGGPVVCLHRH